MNTTFKLFGILVVSLLLFSGPAFAEMLQGHVTAVNPENQTFMIQRITDTGQYENIEVSVPEEASFLGGIASLDEVAVGDEIKVEANQSAMGLGGWKASSIESTTGALDASEPLEGAQADQPQQAGTL